MITRSLLSIIMVVAATFGAAATDLFHIEDFNIEPGQTAQVEILLDNEVQYTAFQSDLYLPEGLALEAQSVALTDRKADHSIATSVLADGGIRMMSYSMSLQPYSGNSGTLVTFRVTAGESFAGPLIIQLRNTRFTTLQGREIPFENTSCTVSAVALLQPGDVNGDGQVNVSDVSTLINNLMSGNESALNPQAADLNDDGSVNITDVSLLINLIMSAV